MNRIDRISYTKPVIETQELQFFIPAEEVENLVNEGLREKRQTVVLKGFRRGQAPIELIKRMYYQELYDSVTRQKIVDNLEKYRRENNLLAIVPEDVEYGLEGDQLKCVVRAKLIPGLRLDNVCAALSEQPIKARRLVMPGADVVDLLQKVEEEILSSRFLRSNGPLQSDGGIVVNISGSNNSFRILPWSFDREARELIESNVGKKVGDTITFTIDSEAANEGGANSEGIDSRPNLITAVITEVLQRKVEELNEDVRKSFIDRLSSGLEESNRVARRASAFEFFLNRFITDEVHERVREAGILGSRHSKIAAAELYLLNLFEQAGLEVKQSELQRAVVERYSEVWQRGVHLSKNDFRYLVDSTFSDLKAMKALDLLAEKAHFEFEDEVCELDRFLEMMSVRTFKRYKDWIKSNFQSSSDNDLAEAKDS